ncbi:hypothetical protein M9Y10_040114 [Tritrichomonas musculus]|uniref:Uncharacterized protein n=1 Tax=Tritrichomonas musculus TaxID=1915356 RepID=A0ABR2GQ34_9EUKA
MYIVFQNFVVILKKRVLAPLVLSVFSNHKYGPLIKLGVDNTNYVQIHYTTNNRIFFSLTNDSFLMYDGSDQSLNLYCKEFKIFNTKRNDNAHIDLLLGLDSKRCIKLHYDYSWPTDPDRNIFINSTDLSIAEAKFITFTKNQSRSKTDSTDIIETFTTTFEDNISVFINDLRKTETDKYLTESECNAKYLAKNELLEINSIGINIAKLYSSIGANMSFGYDDTYNTDFEYKSAKTANSGELHIYVDGYKFQSFLMFGTARNTTINSNLNVNGTITSNGFVHI